MTMTRKNAVSAYTRGHEVGDPSPAQHKSQSPTPEAHEMRQRAAAPSEESTGLCTEWVIRLDFSPSFPWPSRPQPSDSRAEASLAGITAVSVDPFRQQVRWLLLIGRGGLSATSVKLHTLLDLRGPIPAFMHISDGKVSDVSVLDLLLPEAGAFYILDRGYLHFQRLYLLHQANAFFVTRAKANTRYRRLYSHPVDKRTGLLCDQTIVLDGTYTAATYPDKLRRIKYRDPDTGNTLVFLTNHFQLPAAIIPQLYRCRWQVELFFKWIKQYLRIKAFYGTSENAVRTQLWIAVSVYVLVAILKKRLDIPLSLYTIMQVLSLTVFERTPLKQVLIDAEHSLHDRRSTNQLNLFE
ncbi:hypothetical protein BH24PSE2_BH24PSE2_24630 [soil metagenome]